MRKVALAACGVITLLCMATPAYANASPDTGDIVEALQESPIYIAPGTEGTNSDTAAVLEGQMREDDSIVIVMLPSDENTTTSDLEDLTQEISSGLGDGVIVGVSIGDTYDAYASTLPPGVADELMQNADTVSQSPLDTMGTFIRNVHDWERLHPGQVVKPEPEGAPAGSEGFNAGVPVSIGSGVLVAVLVTTGVILFKRRRKTRIHEDVMFTSPRAINGYVHTLMELHDQLASPEFERRENKRRDKKKGFDSSLVRMADALVDVCKYTEAYFSRLHPDKRLSSSVRDTYIEHLQTIETVVKRYMDMTLNPDFYDDPEPAREAGVSSVEGFAEFVLKCIRQNNRTAMTDYSVGTKILAAQRYR